MSRERTNRRGLLIVNTGNGKGKSTAALGILVRSAGYDLKVGMFQFIKSADTRFGEHEAADQLGIAITPLGDGFTWLSDDIDADRRLAQSGWKRVRDCISAEEFDVLILDELTYCLTYGWLDEDEVLDVLRSRPKWMHVVITGRDASTRLLDAADLATEMRLVKHPFQDRGVAAQPGIEL